MTAWRLTYRGVDPDAEGLREALCTLGNGYFATRGAAPESRADGVHYPGTYLAGCYDRATDTVSGHELEHESIVNLPNWLPLTIRIDDGPWLDLAAVDVLAHALVLDLRRGILFRRLRFRDPLGRITRIAQRRFVHLSMPHLAGLETTIVPENYAANLTVRSAIDGGVCNDGVARYRGLRGQHLTGHHGDLPGPDVVRLRVSTIQSKVTVAMAARTRLWCDGTPVRAEPRPVRDGALVGQDVTVPVAAHQRLLVEKIVAVYSSRDRAISEPATDAVDALAEAPRFGALLAPHLLAWQQLWQRFCFTFQGEQHILRTVRLHLFHVLQTISPVVADLDVGVPARGLHGEAYRGHILWDELFVLPILTLRLPALTRAVLRYRYRRLPQARLAAERSGYPGAMFPWQSGSTGREETPVLHLNPRSGHWVPDPTRLQRHAGIAVAYNVSHYYQVTGDRQFLADYGAELLIEIARFFAGLADYDSERGRYVIRGVIGPDEFHTGYPGSGAPGIDNNAYTNVMTAWLLARATEALDAVGEPRRTELRNRLHLGADEVGHWADLTRKLFVPFHDNGIISQFEGYDRLAEFDWDGYRDRYGDIQRLDRILESEGDTPNRYRLSKQADVLMLCYLLSADELGEVLARLGYPLRPDTIPRTVDYYLARTSHGSTLSAVVHAWVLARGNRDRAMHFLTRALASDVTDIQGGTTKEGIHLAAMAGSVDVLQRCFVGIEARGDTLWLDPHWPSRLGALEFSINYRERPLTLRVSGAAVTVHSGPGTRPIQIACRNRTVTLDAGATARFTLG